MAKLVKLFIIFGPVQGTIKVIKKYANPGPPIDESLMSTLCLPRIELLDEPLPPKFQTFVVTKEDAQMLYGSGLIVYDRHHEPPPFPGAGRYASYCYTIITDTPFVNATRSLLELIWAKKADDLVIRTVMNIPLPARRKCLRIVPPLITSSSSNSNKPTTTTTTTTLTNNQSSTSSTDLVSNNNLQQQTNNNNNNHQHHHKRTIDDIYLYRGVTDLPLLDYPLRELFSFLQIDDFLLAFACILMEFRTLIISQDNYKLMMVGETLTSLLLPLKWCNVYVPILPPVYGATYLDAPTSYIMGINTQVTELPENLNHIQCRIYCDESRVVCDAESLALPLFLNDIKKDIIRIKAEFQATHNSKPFNYLDDLKFNRAIRVLFIKTIRKNVLANYERYIVDVSEASSDIRQFDVVSYLSDQPEFMYSFLSKFLDTQLFASFIDENAKRMQRSWLSIFDMDPDELSEHFTDKGLDVAFQSAHRIHLMDLRQEHPNIEIKTVPASPMKLRRRLPALSALANRLSFAKSSTNSTSLDYGSNTNDLSPNATNLAITSSPPIHRNSVATISLQGHISLDPNHLNQSSHGMMPTTAANNNKIIASNNNNNNNNNHSPSSLKPNVALLAQSVPNGKIVELINEVKDLTKGILIEKMDSPDSATVSFAKGRASNKHNISSSTLIGSLCDLIERVWAHGAFASHQDNSACCPLWNHLITFTRLKYLDSKPTKQEFSDGSHLNVLLPTSKQCETTELDRMVVQDSKNLFSSFNLFKSNRFQQINSMARDLINDLKTIHTLKDVKTDIGKARAFIRLSLERKKLSKHLKTLLSDQALLNSLYKPYAFLRCEEEREQFLMYLLTLNAVDLPCYTTTFVNVINTRRLKSGC